MLRTIVSKLSNMGSTGERIKEARLQAQLTQQDLADAAGVSRSAVAQWETGETKHLRPENLFNIAERIGCSPKWLITGKGPKQNISDIDKGPERQVSLIPLLTWAQVRDWHETGGAHSSAPTLERVAVIGTFGPRTFALHVCGDSMEPAFFEGDTIIVDPDREPKGRDYVIVIGKPTSEPTFKQLLVEVDERYLKPANRRYHILPVTADMVIVGVVVMKMRVY